MSHEISLFSGGVNSGAIAAIPLLNVVESYITYYASGSHHTARAKRLDLHKFLTYLTSLRGFSKAEKLKVKDWDFSSVQRFVEDSLRKGESPATVSRRLATLKHMGRTLSEKIAGFINPAKDIKPPKVEAPKPKALTTKEIREVRRRAEERLGEKSSFIRLRNQTIFNFLLDTGLRADEIRLLRLGQIDPKLEWIKSVRTKGRRYRNVYITSDIRPALRDYISAREKELKKFYSKLTRTQDDALPLFVSTYSCIPGEPETFLMGSKTLWRAMHELSAGTPLHPHLLRHSYAIDLLKDSNDVRLVSQALGHSDVRVTMRYTERRDEEVATALEKSRRNGRKNR